MVPNDSAVEHYGRGHVKMWTGVLRVGQSWHRRPQLSVLSTSIRLAVLTLRAHCFEDNRPMNFVSVYPSFSKSCYTLGFKRGSFIRLYFFGCAICAEPGPHCVAHVFGLPLPPIPYTGQRNHVTLALYVHKGYSNLSRNSGSASDINGSLG